ncbi:putative tellurium resistance membrane protein TerC [Flavobacterium sp. CG_9.10]|uniref:hypothetical protein n=1 Tax=Flavobacterium sp. CG_9.10 TaxID=2787729 RepID=UPI0018CBABA0|nr:hypothetical protein [Flavobacterium sp. CG_9.10]MBG6110799.1 putative tellurium resistance membrane protein TerC [Flavobacterium sp. CG_9.10]
MEKSIKIILIIFAVLVGLLVLSSVLGLISNLFNFLRENYTAIFVIVAVISGLILLTADKVESTGLRSTAVLLFFISLLNLVGILIGSFIEQGIESFFK